MEPLTGRERRGLRARAHHLSPSVEVGLAGLSDDVLREVDRALRAEPLVKVRLPGGGVRKEMAPRLAEAVGAHLVGLVGRMAILYRPPAEAAENTEP